MLFFQRLLFVPESHSIGHCQERQHSILRESVHDSSGSWELAEEICAVSNDKITF